MCVTVCVCNPWMCQVTFGYMNGGGLESLLRSMQSVYVPQLTATTSWPESVRKEFTGQMHRFMASLIETVRRAHGGLVCAWGTGVLLLLRGRATVRWAFRRGGGGLPCCHVVFVVECVGGGGMGLVVRCSLTADPC